MKNKKLCLLLMSTLALVACNNTPKPSVTSSLDPSSVTSDVATTSTDNTSIEGTSTSTSTTSSAELSSSTTSSSSLNSQKSWTAADISVMENLLGEAIPYVQLADNYVCVTETDADGDFVYIYDESTTNLLTNYSATLEAAGYKYVGEEKDATNTYTAYYYSKGDIVIQYDYYPGDSEYSASNEIYAWIETSIGGVQTTDTSWPEELSTAMTNIFGEVLPFVALDEAYEYNWSEESKELVILDNCDTDYLTQENYRATLEAAGFVLDEVDSSYGFDIITFTKAIDEDYQIILSMYFYPGDEEVSSGNEIDVRVDEIIHPVTSTTWPSEQIDTLLGATYNIPSFGVNGDYTYYTYHGVLFISGEVDSDITEAYEAQANENGLLTGSNIDFTTFEYYYYIYNWEENFTIDYAYSQDDSSFTICILPAQPTYDSLDDTFPSDKIVSLLGEGKTEVPSFDCNEGSNYKVTMIEADPENGITAFLMIKAIDNGTIGTDSIEDKYLTILETAGWTVDTSDYENSGYIATTENNDVCLTFYTENGVFYLYVEDASSTTIAEGVFDLATSDAQITKNTTTQVVYTSGTYEVTIDKGSAASPANNYLGNGVHLETRVYKGMTLTIGTTEGTLGTVVIECSSSTDANAFNECTLTNCTATVDGTTVTLTPTEGATSVTIDTKSLSGKRLNLIGISIL